MKPNPHKILELRNKNALNQEALAGRAKVSVRTVQRAEAGESIDLQSAQQIAAALGVQPSMLSKQSATSTEDTSDGLQRVALLPTLSARGILDVVSECAECRLDHEIDIGQSALAAAVEFCETLGPKLPVLCPEINDFTGTSANPAQTLVDRLRLEASLNDSLARLAQESVGVYAGSYIDWIKKPRYSIDDMMWLTHRDQRVEPVRFGIIRLGVMGQPQLIARVKVSDAPF